jgi:serine/threonine protein kinase
MKLGHLRGVGKVNNLGYMSSCPDIYLNLENNILDDKLGGGSTTSAYNGATSSKKTENQKHFSNRSLDNPFIAPETLFTKFSDQTAAVDVWSFGMIMYCVLLGQKPESFYAIYRGWYKKCHSHDIELSNLPFIPPSASNFIYDPFSVDFDNPFKLEENMISEDLGIGGSLMEKQGNLNFENVMKCIKNLSCSSLFEDGNSKKFSFKTVA